MYKFHTTADGKKMLIGQMQDQHLLNTIRLYLRKIDEALTLIKNPVLSDPMVAIFHKVVSPEKVKETAEQTIKFSIETLQPYLMEAYIRDDLVNTIKDEMQATFSRSSAMPEIDVFSKLNPPLPDSDDDIVVYGYGYGIEPDFDHY